MSRKFSFYVPRASGFDDIPTQGLT